MLYFYKFIKCYLCWIIIIYILINTVMAIDYTKNDASVGWHFVSVPTAGYMAKHIIYEMPGHPINRLEDHSTSFFIRRCQNVQCRDRFTIDWWNPYGYQFEPYTPDNYDAVGTVDVTGIVGFETYGTGILIKDNLVLTAGHCVCRKLPGNTSLVPSDCNLRGSFNLHNVTLVKSLTKEDVTVSGDVSVYNNYSRPALCGDIAVIKLDTPISKVAKVKPIPLANPQSYSISKGDTLNVVGFGPSGPCCQDSSPYLERKVVKLPITKEYENGDIESSGEMSLCGGDSGGPAINTAGYVVGVTSGSCNPYNVTCKQCDMRLCSTLNPDVYKWISNIA